MVPSSIRFCAQIQSLGDKDIFMAFVVVLESTCKTMVTEYGDLVTHTPSGFFNESDYSFNSAVRLIARHQAISRQRLKNLIDLCKIVDQHLKVVI